MSSGDSAERLHKLLAELESSLKPAPRIPCEPPEGTEPKAHLLIYSFLVWESSPSAAAPALETLCREIIDPNELRVALPEEIASWCGGKDAIGLERAARLRASLNDLYRREHGVTMTRLDSLSKREVRDYLDSLEGMPPFVAARVSLLGFGGHAAPLDARLQRMLEARQAIESGRSMAETERWLERQIRASDSERAALLLEAWRESAAPAGRKRSGSAAKPPKEAAAPSRPEGRAKQSKAKRPKKDS